MSKTKTKTKKITAEQFSELVTNAGAAFEQARNKAQDCLSEGRAVVAQIRSFLESPGGASTEALADARDAMRRTLDSMNSWADLIGDKPTKAWVRAQLADLRSSGSVQLRFPWESNA